MKKQIFFIFAMFSISIIFAQTHPEFTVVKKIKTTPVKNQGAAGACWSFATTSFIETEAIRKGKKEYDLSEMYFVYYSYLDKAEDYVRFHGNATFGEGGQAHDVLNVIKKHGITTEGAYSGKVYQLPYHYHIDMVKNLKSIVDNAASIKDAALAPTWYVAFKAVLESYMGKPPVNFNVGESLFNPKSFNKSEINFNPDDYVEFTSYSHHPFYEQFDLEIPDNWSHDDYYNVPINELMEIMDNAIEKGYSIAWDGDVTEKGFDTGTSIADLSKKDLKKIKDEGFQKYRQITFENYKTTDDHLMHIVGTAKNKDDELYYITKNSWGVFDEHGGYFYISKDYVKLKTIAFLVHKNAVPNYIARKCGIK